MQVVAFLTLFFALAQSATLVPIDSSSVNVKHSGQDFSYSINENHGIAIEPLHQHQIPVIKIAPGSHVIKQEHVPIVEQEIKPLQPQLKTTSIAGITYTSPIGVVPAYTYLPAQQYAIPIPYGINYPYSLIPAV